LHRDPPWVPGQLFAMGDPQFWATSRLWDEESQQWLKLPHGMASDRRGFARAVVVPAAALCKAPATS
jgi:hypothetical protein